MSIDEWKVVAEVERSKSYAHDIYHQICEGHFSGDPDNAVTLVYFEEVESDVGGPDRFMPVVRLGSGAVMWASEMFQQFTEEVEPPLTDKAKEDGVVELNGLLSNLEEDLKRTEALILLDAQIDALAKRPEYMQLVTRERVRAIANGKVPDEAYMLLRSRLLVMEDLRALHDAVRSED